MLVADVEGDRRTMDEGIPVDVKASSVPRGVPVDAREQRLHVPGIRTASERCGIAVEAAAENRQRPCADATAGGGERARVVELEDAVGEEDVSARENATPVGERAGADAFPVRRCAAACVAMMDAHVAKFDVACGSQASARGGLDEIEPVGEGESGDVELARAGVLEHAAVPVRVDRQALVAEQAEVVLRQQDLAL